MPHLSALVTFCTQVPPGGQVGTKVLEKQNNKEKPQRSAAGSRDNSSHHALVLQDGQ
jgi:hypothetical protein